MFGEFSGTDLWAWTGRAIVALFLVHAVRESLRYWRAEKRNASPVHGPPAASSEATGPVGLHPQNDTAA